MPRLCSESSRAAQSLHKIARRFYYVKERWVNIYLPLADSLSGYGPVGSVNRPVRLSASGGDPHGGRNPGLSGTCPAIAFGDGGWCVG